MIRAGFGSESVTCAEHTTCEAPEAETLIDGFEQLMTTGLAIQGWFQQVASGERITS